MHDGSWHSHATATSHAGSRHEDGAYRDAAPRVRSRRDVHTATIRTLQACRMDAAHEQAM